MDGRMEEKKEKDGWIYRQTDRQTNWQMDRHKWLHTICVEQKTTVSFKHLHLLFCPPYTERGWAQVWKMPDGSVISYLPLFLSLSLSGRCQFLGLLISSMRLWEQQAPLAWMLSKACAVFPVWKACGVLAWSRMLCEALSLQVLLPRSSSWICPWYSHAELCWVHYATLLCIFCFDLFPVSGWKHAWFKMLMQYLVSLCIWKFYSPNNSY